MYKCEFCKSLIQRHIKSSKVVVLLRRKVYPLREKVFKVKNEHNKSKWKDDPGGSGYETIKEKVACPECKIKFSK